jgi:thioredoxin-dependent peroxiredoxin
MSQFLQLSDGKAETLQSFCQRSHRATVLYFYPKDMTSACTKQAEQFRDQIAWFESRGIGIVGASRDSLVRHNKFIDKHALPFPLITDFDEYLCRKFDVIAEKSMYGRKYLGVVRSTFLLDREAIVLQEWRGVNVADHIDKLKSYIQGWINDPV